MPFDKEKYWQERQAKKNFSEDWAKWRAEMVTKAGPHMLKLMPQLFTQAAYREYLEYKVEEDRAKTLLGDGIELSQPHETIDSLEPLTTASPVEEGNLSNAGTTDSNSSVEQR